MTFRAALAACSASLLLALAAAAPSGTHAAALRASSNKSARDAAEAQAGGSSPSKRQRRRGLARAVGRGPMKKNQKQTAGDGGGDGDEAQTPLTEEELGKLLDFAIVGFPKTGTSFMEHYLFGRAYPEAYLDNTEHCLSHEDTVGSLNGLVTKRGFEIGAVMEDEDTGAKTPVKNAIKCPHELYGEWNVGNYEKYYPEMKFIVSTRHPVFWFQSFFNYKLRQMNKKTKNGEIVWAPSTESLMGPCANDTPYKYGAPHENKIQDRHNVCTDGAKFHHGLSRLGKTKMKSKRELGLLEHHGMSVHRMPKTKVFLMELDQFKVESPEDEARGAQFLDDLRDFVGLEHDLPPLYQHEGHTLKGQVADLAIDICDEEHALVRAELVETGRAAYVWIRDYFLKSDDVVVSNKEHFLDLIERWQYDPCGVEEEQI